MSLKRNIPASSIAEVVMAVAVIASCIGISALVFSRAILVTTDFESVRSQTQIQSELWKNLVLHTVPEAPEDEQMQLENDPIHDSLFVITYTGKNGRLLWTQHWLKDE